MERSALAKTTSKEISFVIEDPIERERFLSEVRKKTRFVNLQLQFKHQKVSITIRGPRERVLYAISLIRKIHQETRLSSMDESEKNSAS
ncbi:MAG: hypothetical protein ACXQS8_00940 [Candidatus Helarchaeales archaeon]